MSIVVRCSVDLNSDYPKADCASEIPTAAVAANVFGVLIMIWLSVASSDRALKDWCPRFRSSYHSAVSSFANFGIEGTQQLVNSSVASVQKYA
jgi:hypothetical protein